MNALLIAIQIVLYTLQSFFCKLFSVNCRETRAVTPVFNVIFGGVIGFVTLAVSGFRFSPSPATWAFGIVNAAVLFLYNAMLIGATSRGSYAFASIANLFGGILVPMCVSLLLWHDTLSPMKIAGIALMLISFVVINLGGISMKGAGGVYYLFCALLFLANGTFGTIMDSQQRVMNGTERTEIIVISYLCLAIFSLAGIAVQQKKDFSKSFAIGGKALLFGLGSGAVAVLAVNLLLVLLARVPVSIYYTVENGGVLAASVLCSAVFLREKLKKNQVIGILLSIVSITMLSITPDLIQKIADVFRK